MAYVTNNKIALLNTNENVQPPRHAITIMYPANEQNVHGLVSFSQKDKFSETKIVANIKNLNPNSLHAIHVHEFGDLTNGCVTAGPHFNPYNKEHGGPNDEVRHVGDLGNIKTDEKGMGYLAITDKYVSLFDGYNNIIGNTHNMIM